MAESEDEDEPEEEKQLDFAAELAGDDFPLEVHKKGFNHATLFYRDMSKYPLLAAQEEKDLSRIIMNPAVPQVMKIDAINKFILHNLRLVIYVAKKYRFRAEQLGSSMELLDLIGEGVLGLRRAAEGYDHRLNFRFATYAFWWIKQSIMRAIQDKAPMVRMPVHAQDKNRKIMFAIGRFIRQVGREPEPLEIAAELKVSEAFVREKMRLMWETPGYWRKLARLDQPIGDGDTYLSEIVANQNILHPESAAIARSELEFAERRIAEILALARKIMKPRDFEIFRMVYGLHNNSFKRMTLEEVAEEYGVTRERIRQIIERNAWFRLKIAGLKVGEEWFKKELNRIQLLENLAGRRAFSAKSPK